MHNIRANLKNSTAFSRGVLEVSGVRHYDYNGLSRVDVDIRFIDQHNNEYKDVIFFEVDKKFENFLNPFCGDWLVAALLLIAMRHNVNLKVKYPVAKSMIENVKKLTKIITAWFSNYKSIDIDYIPEKKSNYAEKNKWNASFLTLGVDSSFTLLKHFEEAKEDPSDKTDYVIFIKGFDIPLDGFEKIYFQTKEQIEFLSRRVNVKPIFISTNLKMVSLQLNVNWEIYHGSALAAVGLLLSNGIKRLFIPSTSYPKHLHPWGSHIVTDNLWSNGGLDIYHDGFEFSRLEKVEFLSNKYSELIGKALRVCWRNCCGDDMQYNCCRCEKCLRTIVPIYVNGSLKKFPCFSISSPKVLVNNLRKIKITAKVEHHWMDIYRYIKIASRSKGKYEKMIRKIIYRKLMNLKMRKGINFLFKSLD